MVLVCLRGLVIVNLQIRDEPSGYSVRGNNFPSSMKHHLSAPPGYVSQEYRGRSNTVANTIANYNNICSIYRSNINNNRFNQEYIMGSEKNLIL